MKNNQPRKQSGKGKGQWIKKETVWINESWRDAQKLLRTVVYVK